MADSLGHRDPSLARSQDITEIRTETPRTMPHRVSRRGAGAVGAATRVHSPAFPGRLRRASRVALSRGEIFDASSAPRRRHPPRRERRSPAPGPGPDHPGHCRHRPGTRAPTVVSRQRIRRHPGRRAETSRTETSRTAPRSPEGSTESTGRQSAAHRSDPDPAAATSRPPRPRPRPRGRPHPRSHHRLAVTRAAAADHREPTSAPDVGGDGRRGRRAPSASRRCRSPWQEPGSRARSPRPSAGRGRSGMRAARSAWARWEQLSGEKCRFGNQEDRVTLPSVRHPPCRRLRNRPERLLQPYPRPITCQSAPKLVSNRHTRTRAGLPGPPQTGTAGDMRPGAARTGIGISSPRRAPAGTPRRPAAAGSRSSSTSPALPRATRRHAA